MIPIEGMKTVPQFHDDDIMMGAFVGLVRFALREKEIIDRFKADTGIDLSKLVSKSPIEKMIDTACGHNGRMEIISFVDWVNVNLWGEESGVNDDTPIFIDERREA